MCLFTLQSSTEPGVLGPQAYWVLWLKSDWEIVLNPNENFGIIPTSNISKANPLQAPMAWFCVWYSMDKLAGDLLFGLKLVKLNSSNGIDVIYLEKLGRIGDFRVAFHLGFKATPSAKPFIWKLVLFTCKQRE